ncbi:hypothetical protein DFJ74DRAFT_320297 [Hyaloraphidium curvatum]|nr:hypothetical protein DFJ74DRAFT_320297 [Hyaloraphidium curvatum]
MPPRRRRVAGDNAAADDVPGPAPAEPTGEAVLCELRRSGPSRSNALLQAALFLCLVGFTWLLAVAPPAAHGLARTARLPQPLTAIGVSHWTRAAPLHAANRTHAWQLGEIEGRLAAAIENAGKGPVLDAILGRVRELAGQTVDGDAEAVLAALRAARATTADLDRGRGSLSFLKRVFNLVNAMWAVGIIGVTISLAPVLAAFLPTIIGALIGILRSLWSVFGPIIILLFVYGWRPALYLLAASSFGSVDDQDISVDVRIYSAMLVALLSSSAASWTMAELYSVAVLEREPANALAMLAPGALLAPLAHITGSRLLGFLTVVSIFSALGAGMQAFPGGYVVGFGSKSALNRSLAAACMLTVATAAIQALGTDAHRALLAPFSPGLQTFGASVYYLALLIRSSSVYMGFQPQFAGGMLASLVLGALAGTVGTGLSYLQNTAFVFAYLFALDAAMWLGSGVSFWLGVLVASCGMVGAAYAAHRYPAVLEALYGMVPGSG